jgi:hypothetical protein
MVTFRIGFNVLAQCAVKSNIWNLGQEAKFHVTLLSFQL